MSDASTEQRDDSRFRAFINHGGFWRFLLVLVVYLTVYIGSGKIIGAVGGHFAHDDVLSGPGAVFVQITASLIVGAVVLLGFGAYMGWLREVFARQPVYRSWWMWLAPVIVVVPILLRLLGISWGDIPVGVIVLVLATGLLIGFVEELVYRGFGIKMLRDGGHGELAVAALSSLLFALSHTANLLSGQSITTVAPTVLYTFAFGVLMYLSLRSIGFLAGVVILHGLTDPTGILASGGVDKVATGNGPNAFLSGAGFATFVVIAAGVVLLIFVRGNARQPAES